MERTELTGRTCDQLREVAKNLVISGRWDMNKGQLIKAILEARTVTGVTGVTEVKAEAKAKAEVKEQVITEDTPTIDVVGKNNYVENVKVDTLVAFRLANGKVKSAKVVNKSSKNRRLKLITEYNKEFVVEFKDIIWVRTGKLWPKGVYNLLKGTTGNDRETTTAK